jgi:hypothetical protein
MLTEIDPKRPIDSISRRDFGRNTTLAALSALLVPGKHPASAAHSSRTLSTSAKQDATKKESDFSPESQAEIDARIQAIFGKYGSRFTDDEKDQLRVFVADFQRSLDRLRSYPLANSDEPVSFVRPLKTSESGRK